jgi:hypothetical protein
VTAGGVLFIGATIYDHKFRAFDSQNGQAALGDGAAVFGSGDAFDVHGGWKAVRGDCGERGARSEGAEWAGLMWRLRCRK